MLEEIILQQYCTLRPLLDFKKGFQGEAEKSELKSFLRVTEKLTDDISVATDELKEVFLKGTRTLKRFTAVDDSYERRRRAAGSSVLNRTTCLLCF